MQRSQEHILDYHYFFGLTAESEGKTFSHNLEKNNNKTNKQ